MCAAGFYKKYLRYGQRADEQGKRRLSSPGYGYDFFRNFFIVHLVDRQGNVRGAPGKLHLLRIAPFFHNLFHVERLEHLPAAIEDQHVVIQITNVFLQPTDEHFFPAATGEDILPKISSRGLSGLEKNTLSVGLSDFFQPAVAGNGMRGARLQKDTGKNRRDQRRKHQNGNYQYHPPFYAHFLSCPLPARCSAAPSFLPHDRPAPPP